MRFEQDFATAQGLAEALPTAIIALIIGKNFRPVRRSVQATRRAGKVRCSCRLQRFNHASLAHSGCIRIAIRAVERKRQIRARGFPRAGIMTASEAPEAVSSLASVAGLATSARRPAGGFEKRPLAGFRSISHTNSTIPYTGLGTCGRNPAPATILPEEAGRRLTTIRERNQP